MNRRTWTASLWLGLIAALCAFLVLFVMAWGLSLLAPNFWFDATQRARIADDVHHVADQLQSQHKQLPDIAKTIVARVDAEPGYAVAVLDESGKFVAGDAALASNGSGIASAGQFGAAGRRLTPPLPGIGVRDIDFRGTLYAMRPPTTHGINFVRLPLTTLYSPPSVVRITGGVVVIAPTQDYLNSISSIELGVALGLVVLTFVGVFFGARRTLVSAVRPMERLRSGLMRLAHGDYARLETFDPNDEDARDLVAAYNAVSSEMQSASKQQAEIEEKLRQFVADAGHELRTPLAVIMGYVQLLRAGGPADGEMSARVFSEIDDQGRRMSVLIQKLLLLTRLESQEPNDVKILDAADVARSVVESFRPLANGATLTLKAQDDALVQVSESELHEAIGNLIDNALKYAPRSHIEARVRSEGSYVYIAVSDDGPGMSPEVRARAFERFSRGEMGGSIAGSGLGLAIVERAVERAGGSVNLDSAIGKGTTVELRFPAWQHVTKN